MAEWSISQQRNEPEARSLFLSGDFEACLAALGGARSPEGVILRARCLLRLDRMAEARLLLLNTKTSLAVASEHYGVLSAAYIRLGDFPAAHALLQECLRSGKTARDRNFFSYYTAFALWAEGKSEEADAYAVQCAERDIAPAAKELRGWIASSQGNHATAVEHFTAALQASLALENPEMFVRAKILWALTHIACEMYLPHLLDDIRTGLASLPDTPGIRVPKMHACRYAAWCHAISGDFTEAFRLIRMAARLCGDDAWRVTALCERAHLALSVYGTAEEYIAEARECADSVSWLETHSEERVGLLYLANLLSRTDILAARSYLETYNALAPTAPDMAHDKDECARAFESYVNACIDQMSGDYVSASANYAKAYAIYRKAGYVWRAILAAVGKADLAGGSKTYAEYAADQLRRFPNSWLRSLIQEKLAELPVRSSTPTFTAMQMEIMRGICAGKTDKEIAEQICRSYATVRHHLHHLRELTGAKNRADLAAYCARKGLLDRQD
jgi:DNA-binding NarL/FixJ family response regulator